MIDERMPVIVGVGQVTKKDEALERCSSPADLMLESARLAAEDAGCNERLLQNLDVVVVVRSFREVLKNSPQYLADQLGASRAQCYLTPFGGNLPQMLVNRYFEAIANGKVQSVLLCGAEAIDNARRCAKAGVEPNWFVEQDSQHEYLVPNKRFSIPEEEAYGLHIPVRCYPLFENALRHHRGESIAAHQLKMGELFAPFTQVASERPTAWYPIQRSAEEIATATPSNRYVGWPYTKYMNAMNNINQGAALILTSVGHAKSLGIPEDRWMFLHGCADANDSIAIGERVNYHSSPALRTTGEVAFEQAGWTLDAVDFIDIYSCFPVAVEIACEMLGLAEDDPRGLTVTGGLPYHGGAGNNYVMNSIATMVEVLRAHPGRNGLVTANGGYLTKHALGLYSTEPPPARAADQPWQRTDPAVYQAKIDALAHPTLKADGTGAASVETYTILFDRHNEATEGLVMTRLKDGSRCPAKVTDTALLEGWVQEDAIGLEGHIQTDTDGINVFAI